LGLAPAFLMTLCTNGSEPAPGAAPFVWVSWLDARSWLGLVWGVFSWVGIATHVAVHEINAFCASEPPQPTAPSDADILAAATDPIKFEALLTYIEQAAAWWVWSHNCVCSATGTPTCDTGWVDFTSVLDAGALNRAKGIGFTVPADALLCGVKVKLTAGTTTMRLWDYGPGGGPSVVLYSQSVTFTGATQTIPLGTAQTLHSGKNYHLMFQEYTGAHYVHWGANPSSGLHAGTYANYVTYVEDDPPVESGTSQSTYKHLIEPQICSVAGGCASSPTEPANPPVPDTDIPIQPVLVCSGDDLCNLVQQLQVSVTHNRTMIDLIQRQSVPFGYIVGTVHSGLSGSGTLTVQGTLGLLAQLATVPGVWGRSADNPQRYIPAPLNLTVATADGDQDTHWVHFAEELWFPPAAGAMTTIHYKFAPGCNGAITELVREP